MKRLAVLPLPPLLFFALLIPYSLINRYVIVDWLGCSCPIVDEAGNLIENTFNANDFTALFWSLTAIASTALSVFLSKRLHQNKYFRVGYVVGVLLLSLFLASCFSTMMMWK